MAGIDEIRPMAVFLILTFAGARVRHIDLRPSA